MDEKLKAEFKKEFDALCDKYKVDIRITISPRDAVAAEPEMGVFGDGTDFPVMK